MKGKVLLILILMGLLVACGGGWDCSGNLYNCSDFSSCDEVMKYFRACPGDPSRLDGDNDGVPCESLCQ